MAHTRPWDNTLPAGSRAANQIDDSARETKVDLTERCEEALIVSMTGDPWVPRPEISGAVTDKRLMIGPQDIEAGTTPTRLATAVSIFVAGTFGVPVVLPIGAILQYAELLKTGSALACTAKLSYITHATGPVRTDLFSVTVATATATFNLAQASIPLNHTIAVDRHYFIELSCPSAGTYNVHGVKVTYDTPDSRYMR